MYFFVCSVVVLTFFILYFVYFFTQELLNLCFWFILHSLYPTHMFSHHHFICAFCFCCCFYFIIQAILALYTYFVNNNVERKAEKLASHFLKQLNWKMVKKFEILRFICEISNTFIHGEWIYLFIFIFGCWIVVVNVWGCFYFFFVTQIYDFIFL